MSFKLSLPLFAAGCLAPAFFFLFRVDGSAPAESQ